MNKVISQNNVMEKINYDVKKYKIKVSPKDNGYQARTTLDLGGAVKTNPRPECYSINFPKEAVNRLVEKIQIILSHYTMKRIKLIGIEEPDTIYYILENTNEVPTITFKKPVLVETNKPKPQKINTDIFNKGFTSNNYTTNPNIMYSVTNVGYTWFNSILERTKKNPDEEEYLANKTPESYRHILLDPILKKALLKHKEYQQKLFRRMHKKWTENEYVFLNKNLQPFVSDTLSKNMPRFFKRNNKYNLGHLTVYGLRHSFATHCRELGMEPEVLAKHMGHTEYETTQKYYVHISKQKKVDALKRVQDKERKGFKVLKMDDIIELESYNKQSFEDFNNNGIEIDEQNKIKDTFLSAFA